MHGAEGEAGSPRWAAHTAGLAGLASHSAEFPLTLLHSPSPRERLLEPQKNLGTSRARPSGRRMAETEQSPWIPGKLGKGAENTASQHPDSFCVVFVNRRHDHSCNYSHRQDKLGSSHSRPKHSCSTGKSGHIAQWLRGGHSPSHAKHNDCIQRRRSESRLRRHYHRCW